MKSYKLINNITGWIVFFVALVTYTLTLEATVSFWDCGEFIAGGYKMEVVHPPGAPLFLLIARFFTLFAPDPSWVPWMVNFLSGLTSAFSVLFLFWITTAFAKKIVIKNGEEPTMHQNLVIMATGVIAGLACTFSDTIWFSAVEGEVYAMSLFFMMAVFWVIMKWEGDEDERHRDRWLILASFLVGISIGVHLMSLLAIPAMCLVYYFKKYKNPTPIGVMVTLVIGFMILGFVFKGLISYMTGMVTSFEYFFVNTVGLPFNSGIIIFYSILVLLLIAGVAVSHMMRLHNLHAAALSLLLIMMGFSTYTMVVIRANVGTPINMNTPSDIFRFESYLNREQYGDRPLMYGPHYNAYPTEIKEGEPRYYKGPNGKYVAIGNRMEYKFADKDMMFFPRMGSWQDDRHSGAYAAILDLDKEEDPSKGDNLRFFIKYQVGFMYWRYFMWNFSGRQNDVQGRYDQQNNQGKWITGIPFIDRFRIGPQDNAPEDQKNNKAHNTYYMIPFILGLIGIFFHLSKDPKSFIIVAALFLFSGVFQVIYLNSPPFEPRERDYTLVASFVTFCLWIGFGMLAIYELLREAIKQHKPALILAFSLAAIAPILLATNNWDDHDRSERYVALEFAKNYLESVAPNAVIFTQGDNDTYPLWYAQEVEGIRSDVRVVNLSLLGVDWYVEQLTRAVNDAAPLKLIHQPDQYKGNRRDVTRYFDTGKVDQNKAIELENVIKFIASDDRAAKVRVQSGDFINYLPIKKVKLTVDKEAVMGGDIVPTDYQNRMVDVMEWNLGQNNLLKNDLITLDLIASNLWERPIYFAVSVSPSSYLGLGKYFQLEGLAYRIVPVQSGGSGANAGYVAENLMYDNVVGKFSYGGIEDKKTITYTVKEGETLESVALKFYYTATEFKEMTGVTGELTAGQKVKVEVPADIYLDENTLRMTMNLRSNFARLAEGFLDAGKPKKAAEVLDVCMQKLPPGSVPYNIFMIRFPEIYYQAGDQEKARLLVRGLSDYYWQNFLYNNDLVNAGFGSGVVQRERDQSIAVMQELLRVTNGRNDEVMAKELTDRMLQVQSMLGMGQ